MMKTIVIVLRPRFKSPRECSNCTRVLTVKNTAGMVGHVGPVCRGGGCD
jgi:hypothetical protein